MNRRKLGFSVYGYNWIKIIGGYIATYKGGLALHITDKKAILLPYQELNDERKRFSFIRTFHLKSFSLMTETGANYLFPITLLHILLRIYLLTISNHGIEIKNGLWLKNGDELRISFHCALFFNLFMLLCNFFKFLKEKIKIYVGKTSEN